jgi:hypothetical protein
MNSGPIARISSIGTLLALTACAPTLQDNLVCAPARSSSPYTALSPTGHSASGALHVSVYRVVAEQGAVERCGQLALRKEVVLIRHARPNVELWEIRDFFAGDGTFITRAREDVSAQLASSGHYAGNLVLPIPASTPPGRYRIVTRLIEKKGNRERVLAVTATHFRVGVNAGPENRVRPGTRH